MSLLNPVLAYLSKLFLPAPQDCWKSKRVNNKYNRAGRSKDCTLSTGKSFPGCSVGVIGAILIGSNRHQKIETIFDYPASNRHIWAPLGINHPTYLLIYLGFNLGNKNKTQLSAYSPPAIRRQKHFAILTNFPGYKYFR